VISLTTPVRHGRAVGAVCLAVAATACQGAATDNPSQPTISAPAPTVAAAQISISPATGSRGVKPGAGITVQVTDGSLTSVTAKGGKDHLTGHQTASLWRRRQTMNTGTRYVVRATAVDAAGRSVTVTSSFRTLRPRNTVRAVIFQAAGQTYGVGMPIFINFDQPVVNKRAVEHALELRSSKPLVGAWYWDGDSTVEFRPRSYWPANTTVHFVGHLDGVEVAPGVYGAHTLKQTFRIGRSLIAVGSTVTHHIQIYLNKRLLGNWPMSSGKPGDDTPNGTYLTIEKGNPVEMKGPGYDIMVPFSVRFTWSGDYLHDAFWSVGQQGFSNVSHGCVNLSPANAETYYNLSVPGDPVTISGSPRGGAWGNGWTVWFLSWRELLRGSATHKAVRVGPNGSTFVSPSILRAGYLRPPLEAPEKGNSQPA
jgi:lipoprotein-anchoring transpeptidase ErfK/SrfK